MKLNIERGTVVWNVLQFCDTSKAPDSSHVGEDLLQVEYSGNWLVDLGWYKDVFTVMIILHDDWNHPVAQYISCTWTDMQETLQAAIDWCEQNA